MFLNNKSKRLGDFAAATIVVKETPRKQFAKFLETGSNPDHWIPAESTSPNDALLQSIIHYIRHADYLMMKDLATRRPSLVNYPELAAAVIRNIITRIQLSHQLSEDFKPEILVDQAAVKLPELVSLYEKLNGF